jgi:hypothetical protein
MIGTDVNLFQIRTYYCRYKSIVVKLVTLHTAYSEIPGLHGGEDEDDCLLGFCAV